jgi:hypothetical protein
MMILILIPKVRRIVTVIQMMGSLKNWRGRKLIRIGYTQSFGIMMLER